MSLVFLLLLLVLACREKAMVVVVVVVLSSLVAFFLRQVMMLCKNISYQYGVQVRGEVVTSKQASNPMQGSDPIENKKRTKNRIVSVLSAVEKDIEEAGCQCIFPRTEKQVLKLKNNGLL